jgi:hypothetical protein
MVITTYRSDAYSRNISNESERPCLWPEEFRIDNLPTWIYADNQPPKDIRECEAKISSLEFTIKDIELQIEIRELELKTGHSRHSSAFDFEKWKIGALKARQTHLYMLNAYTYWMIKNKPITSGANSKLEKLIKLLIKDPSDFCEQAGLLLD